MPLPPIPPELKAIVPFLQRAEEMRSKDPVISFWCEYYAVKKGLALRLPGGESRNFLFGLMDSLEATKKLLRDHEAITNDEVGHVYVENFADRIFVMADDEDRRGATSRSTAKKFLAAGQFFDLLSVFEGAKQTQGPKTSEKRTYAKWRATEISKAFRDNRTPPPPPSPVPASSSPLPSASNHTDPNTSQTLTISSISSASPRDHPSASSSTPPPGHGHTRSPTTQSPPTATTSITITSPGPTNGNGSGNGSSRRRASDVSASTPTRLTPNSSPAWSTRVQATPDPATNGGKHPVGAESSPGKGKRLRRGLSSLSSRAAPGGVDEDSETDPGTEEDDNGGGSGGLNAGKGRMFNSQEFGHEVNGDNNGSNGGEWDNRQASLAVQAPESRHQSFAQRPADSGQPYASSTVTSPPIASPVPYIPSHPPVSPTAAGHSVQNGPPALVSAPVHYAQTDSTPSSQSSSRQTSPKSAQPAFPQTPTKQTSPKSAYSTPGRSSPPGAPPPSAASTNTTPVSSHTSIASASTPRSSPAPPSSSPAPTVTTPTGTPTSSVPPTALVLPPRRVHFSGSTVGGLSVASSSPESSPEHTPTSLPDHRAPLQITGPPSTSPTHSRRHEPTPRAPAAILPPPDPMDILPPLSTALVRPQSYQINRAAPVPSVAYPTASAPPYPEPTYASPPPVVHTHHHHTSSHSPSQAHAQPAVHSQSLVHVPQASTGSSYSYVPATPRVSGSPPLPTVISGPATQRAQKHAKFAISALDYDDLDTARKELLSALAIINGRAM